MDLHLRVLSTRTLLKLHHNHVLSSSNGVKLALFVPAAGAWRFRPLHPEHSARLNDEPVHCLTPIHVGDTIELGRKKLFVESLSVPEHVPNEDPSPACRVMIEGGKAIVTRSEMLIGTADLCGIRLPQSTRVEPQRALLAPLDGGWYLFDLTGADARDGEVSDLDWVLCDGRKVRFGLAALSFHFCDDKPTARDETLSNKAALTATAEGNPTATSPDDSAALRAKFPDDPVYARLVWVCHRLFHGNLPPPTNTPKAGISGALARWRGEAPLETVDRIHDRLAKDPRSRDARVELARFCEKLGHLELCLQVLKRLVQETPRDLELLVALAKLNFQLGKKADRAEATRLLDLENAERCIEQALRLRPDDSLQDLKKEIVVERTILRNHLDALRTHQPESSTT